jgi:hypothetical protein
MSFLDSLKSMFSGGSESSYDKSGYWIYVRCNRCGEAIKTRIDLQNNLHPLDEGGYITRKTLVGNKLCFERIEVTLHFNGNRQVVDREIVRGEFITAEEFEAAA